jgi:hypothetical protein
MKKTWACLLLGLLMTVPVYLLLVTSEPVRAWSASNASYAAFQPLFRALNSVGGEQHEDIITTVWLLLSFVIALALATLAVGLATRWRRRGARP